jgi:hypothetical protein
MFTGSSLETFKLRFFHSFKIWGFLKVIIFEFLNIVISRREMGCTTHKRVKFTFVLTVSNCTRALKKSLKEARKIQFSGSYNS